MGELFRSFEDNNEYQARIKKLAEQFEEVELRGRFDFNKIAEDFIKKLKEEDES
jgi:hypothetical protein